METLTQLKTVSLDTIEAVLPIMEDIAEDDNYIIEEITERLGFTEAERKEEVEKWLQKYSFELIKDAKKIVKEVDAFKEVYNKDDETIEKSQNKYKFLAKVWFGDVYDSQHEDALKELLADLEKTKANVTADFLIKRAIKNFKKVLKI